MVVSATWVTAHSQVTLDDERNNCQSVQEWLGTLFHPMILSCRPDPWKRSKFATGYHNICDQPDQTVGSLTLWGVMRDRYRLGHGSVDSNNILSLLNVQSGLRKFLQKRSIGVSVAMRQTQHWKGGYGNIVPESHGSLIEMMGAVCGRWRASLLQDTSCISALSDGKGFSLGT